MGVVVKRRAGWLGATAALTVAVLLLAMPGGGAQEVTPIPVGPTVGLELVAAGLSAPVQVLSPPDGSGRLFIVDQVGRIRVVSANGVLREAPFLDLRDRMVALRPDFDERGALGLAFHPDYAANGRLFVYYSAPLRPEGPAGWDHTSHISEFTVSDDPDIADGGSERVVLQVDQPQANHNGGQVMFGPTDGHLYISLGDGGGGSDSGTGHTPAIGNAQDTTNVLGAILRIDIDGAEPYAIPEDNPFVGREGRDEIFAYGLRNPYRFTFDPGGDGALLAGDAGQALWEEVSVVVNGGNYGWNITEGTHCFDPDAPTQSPEDCPATGPGGDALIDPVIEYANSRQPGGVGAVIVGGHVYRGSDVPHLQGQYVFGDWSASSAEPDGTLLVAEPAGAGLWPIREIAVEDAAGGRLGHYVLGFGQDTDGEVYVLSSDRAAPSGDTGRVYRLTAADSGGAQACPPGEVDTAPFTDRAAIPAAHLANIDCASFHDIVEGFADGSSGPTLPVRRDQMASFLIRAAEFATDQQLASQTQAFTDVPRATTHFANVNAAAELGLAQGFGDGTYRPGNDVHRDQMTTFVIRLLAHLVGE
ncbi:MAG: PQQ-dependent sugar dehydrogenase [Egibacteraceae bacterium]